MTPAGPNSPPTAASAPWPLVQRHLTATIDAMEAALLTDDEVRAARAAPSVNNTVEADVDTHYDATVAVPAGVVYPEGGFG